MNATNSMLRIAWTAEHAAYGMQNSMNQCQNRCNAKPDRWFHKASFFGSAEISIVTFRVTLPRAYDLFIFSSWIFSIIFEFDITRQGILI